MDSIINMNGWKQDKKFDRNKKKQTIMIMMMFKVVKKKQKFIMINSSIQAQFWISTSKYGPKQQQQQKIN